MALTISNYNLSYDCNSNNIIATGTVLYNGSPVAQAIVSFGFCSNMSSQFASVYTNSDGTFSSAIATATVYPGSNCIFANAIYNGVKTTAKQSIQIPQCNTTSLTTTYNCSSGSCTPAPTGTTGTYQTLTECQSACSTGTGTGTILNKIMQYKYEILGAIVLIVIILFMSKKK
jgi:hypothetical protein